jgi:hypothetical protein
MESPIRSGGGGGGGGGGLEERIEGGIYGGRNIGCGLEREGTVVLPC